MASMLPEVTQSEGSGSQASVGLIDVLGPLGPLTTLRLLGSPNGDPHSLRIELGK